MRQSDGAGAPDVIQPAPRTVPALPRHKPSKSQPSGPRLSQQVTGDLFGLADIGSIALADAVVIWLGRANALLDTAQARGLLMAWPAVALMALVAFRGAGLYRMRLVVDMSRQAPRLLVAWALVAAVCCPILHWVYGERALTLLAWFCLTPAMLLSARTLCSLGARALLRSGVLARRVALIGALPTLSAAARLVLEDRLTRLTKIIDLPPDLSDDSVKLKVGEIMDELTARDDDDIIVLMPSAQSPGLDLLLDHLCMLPARISLLPVVALQTLDRIDPGDIDTISLPIAIKPVRGWSLIFKTGFDYLVATAMLLIFGLPMLAIALAIKLESPGPVIFRQHRTGRGGRVFRIWKFRSMEVLEDGPQVRQAERDDNRVTRIGRLIRRLSLDELPQIFNVLSGDMSIVGPRPHARAHDAHYAQIISDYRIRFRVKPGITGWAQIHGLRGETKSVEQMAARIGYDVDYVSNYSVWRDIYVVLMTPFRGLLSVNSY